MEDEMKGDGEREEKKNPDLLEEAGALVRHERRGAGHIGARVQGGPDDNGERGRGREIGVGWMGLGEEWGRGEGNVGFGEECGWGGLLEGRGGLGMDVGGEEWGL